MVSVSRNAAVTSLAVTRTRPVTEVDLPSATLTIRDRSVMNRYGGPNLNELYTRIERLVGQMDWQATAEDAR